MQSFQLNDMTRGWFVGAFSPTALASSACEVAVKTHKKGDKEAKHFHKLATEVTLIFSGSAIMFGKTFHAGSIIVIEPNEETAFEALEDTVTVVVKTPGALNDKYLS